MSASVGLRALLGRSLTDKEKKKKKKMAEEASFQDAVASVPGLSGASESAAADQQPKKFPKGVVLGKDGKP